MRSRSAPSWKGLLKDQNAVKYELNSGGHFADAGKRLAKGLRWMLEEE